MTATTGPGRATLLRSLRTADVVLLTVGSVVGSGIFLVPGDVLKAAGGSPPVTVAIWVVGGILTLFGALTFGELGARRPHAGGLYVFIREGFGTGAAFVFGLSLFVAGCSGVVAALAVAFGESVGEIFRLPPLAAKLLAVAAIVMLALLNLGTARRTAMLQNVSAMLRVAVLAGFVAMAAMWMIGAPTMPGITGPAATALHPAAAIAALVAVLWAYEGWQYVTYCVGEMRDPGRTLPRGLALGVALLIGLFVTVNIGCLALLGPARMAASRQALADALGAIGQNGLAAFVRAFVSFSVLAAAHATLFTNSRVIYAMAHDRTFFTQFGVLSPRTGVPVRAVIGCAAVAIALTLFNSFGELLTFVVISNWLFYGIGAASLFVIRRNDADRRPYFATPLYPLVPIAFVGASAIIVVTSWISGPMAARYGLIIAVAGWLGHSLWTRRNRSLPVVERPGKR